MENAEREDENKAIDDTTSVEKEPEESNGNQMQTGVCEDVPVQMDATELVSKAGMRQTRWVQQMKR